MSRIQVSGLSQTIKTGEKKAMNKQRFCSTAREYRDLSLMVHELYNMSEELKKIEEEHHMKQLQRGGISINLAQKGIEIAMDSIEECCDERMIRLIIGLKFTEEKELQEIFGEDANVFAIKDLMNSRDIKLAAEIFEDAMIDVINEENAETENCEMEKDEEKQPEEQNEEIIKMMKKVFDRIAIRRGC